ncbi:MAG TPA: LuxR C-terminal-related transcriptional regulator, partial [Thermoanaerobaculia bacterium]|nr:LuxR C-terminal-related transcriptional regulator [Thermoanaerobaculia bacterium]
RKVPVLVRLGAFQRNETRCATGDPPRELESLETVAAGLSTREIGERFFVSENAVKTRRVVVRQARGEAADAGCAAAKAPGADHLNG